jgi:hypothetical protein
MQLIRNNLADLSSFITCTTMYTIVGPLYYVYPNQPCPEKTHDFRQNFDRLFSHEATISEVKGASFEDCVTDTPYSSSTPNSVTTR